MDGALLNEYKNFKKLVLDTSYNSNIINSNNTNSTNDISNNNTNILNLSYVLNSKFPVDTYNSNTFINDLTSNSSLLQYISKNNTFLAESLIIQFSNLVKLMMFNSNFEYNIQQDKNKLSDIFKKFMNDSEKYVGKVDKEKEFDDCVANMVESLLTGNFEVSSFTFKNSSTKGKLQKTIKLTISKILSIFYFIYARIKLNSVMAHKTNFISNLKNLFHCLILQEKVSLELSKENITICLKALESINYINLEKECESNPIEVIELLKLINIACIRYSKSSQIHKLLNTFNDKIKFYLKEEVTFFMNNDLPKSKSLMNSLKHVHSTYLRNFILSVYLYNITSDRSDTSFIYSEIIPMLTNYAKQNLKTEFFPNARENYKKLSAVFMDLVGVPLDYYMDFDVNWQLERNSSLYHFIIKDQDMSKEGTGISVNNTDEQETIVSKEDLSKYNKLIMNTRQKVGQDTPKKKHIAIPKNMLKDLKHEDPDENKLVRSNSITSVGGRSIKSYDFKGNDDEEVSKGNLKTRVIKIKPHTKKKGPGLPKHGQSGVLPTGNTNYNNKQSNEVQNLINNLKPIKIEDEVDHGNKEITEEKLIENTNENEEENKSIELNTKSKEEKDKKDRDSHIKIDDNEDKTLEQINIEELEKANANDIKEKELINKAKDQEDEIKEISVSKELKQDSTGLYINNLARLFLKLVYTKLLNGLFKKYKLKTMNRDLEKIKIVSIKSKEPIEEVVLKEKLVNKLINNLIIIYNNRSRQNLLLKIFLTC